MRAAIFRRSIRPVTRQRSGRTDGGARSDPGLPGHLFRDESAGPRTRLADRPIESRPRHTDPASSHSWEGACNPYARFTGAIVGTLQGKRGF